MFSEFLEGIGWSNIALNHSQTTVRVLGMDSKKDSLNSIDNDELILKIHYIILLWVIAYVSP